MHLAMTIWTRCNRILHGIVAIIGKMFFVVYFKIRRSI
jgi:hypothetical protein